MSSFSFHTLIKPEELLKIIQLPEVRIIDSRFFLDNPEKGSRDYSEAHIPGAVYAHLDNDLSGDIIPGKTGRHPLPDKKQFVNWLSQNGIGNEHQIVVYDQSHGGIAARCWWLFLWIGHSRVAVLDGGFQRWMDLQYPVDREQTEITRSQFKVNKSLVETIDAQSIENSENLVLVDARQEKRYAGSEEPIDPIAGHIPGALNKPFLLNLDENHQFLSEDHLRERFADLDLENNADQVVCYCGSGVTACHNLLAIKEAGLPLPKLYPGSWSEWITDPEREIAIA